MVAGHQVAFFLREIGSADPARRAAAAKGLSRAPGHVAELTALAGDPAPQVRAAAALGLGGQGEAAPIGPLVALCSDPDAEVRRRAVNALDRLGATGPAVAAAFVQRVGDGELRSRPVVLDWLLRFGVPVPTGALVPLLADPDPLIWGPARLLLRLLPEADAVFADLVRTGPDEVRRRALHMLARPQAGIPGMGPDADPETREAAWRRLWDPEPRVTEALLAALEAETEPHARNVLFGALAAHRVPEAVAPAAAWLADPECGPGAAEALAGAGTAEAVDLLRRFVTGPGRQETGPRGATAWELGADLLRRFLAGTGRQEAELRGAAVRALGAAGGVPEAELIFGLLDDPAEPVRLGAVAGLGAFFQRFDGSPRGGLERWRAGRVPGLPLPPPADDPAVRELARRSAERLTRLLTRDVEHADACHNALWHIPEVRPLLPALLGHPEGRVRSTALHLAERFGEMDFAGRLRLLDDAHHAVRQGAALKFLLLVEQESLTSAEQDTLRPHLERGQDDPDHYVRTFTAKALAHLDRAG
ncbi:HEAT repeat domain-containing protein [Thermomonospora cellulosilytica]|uniref:HEAT repeat protein n=1 Tax=Thermomonospora cellulosilytica TaxID=1411118 RepID=A0A7W3RAW6_9ACTN|nr:HEAT repeat domain-containing protein [Thermomonospora cellulosilytica]MBA9006332.1 HEAT repeat protein [Thermomonospora cellulosilytica]